MPRKILGVIPARFGSSRFPGKVLAPIASKSMLQHVYERASMARYLTSTIIATDDQSVFDAARAFGAPVRMTRADHLSGTDRVAEVASAENAEIVVNIQGDEPLIDPAAIDAAILPLIHEPGIANGDAQEEDRRPARDRRPERGEGGNESRRATQSIFRAVRFPMTAERTGVHLLQTYRTLCIPARFSAELFVSAGGSLGTGGAAGAVAGSGERLLDPRSRNRVRIVGVDTPEDLERVSHLLMARLCDCAGGAGGFEWLNTYS